MWAIEDGAVPSDIVYREVGGKYVKFYVYKPTDEAFKECLFSDICVPIIIKNPNSYDLEDYQVVINLEDIGLAGKYVRVIYYDISTDKFEFVNFCYEQSNGECNETVSSVIWVKVPSIPANGNTVIYIYPSDTNYATTGDNVFDFYDDFNDGVLDANNWETYTKSGQASFIEEDGYLKITLNGDTVGRIYSKTSFSNVILEVKVMSDNKAERTTLGFVDYGDLSQQSNAVVTFLNDADLADDARFNTQKDGSWGSEQVLFSPYSTNTCLLYTSDAADE